MALAMIVFIGLSNTLVQTEKSGNDNFWVNCHEIHGSHVDVACGFFFFMNHDRLHLLHIPAHQNFALRFIRVGNILDMIWIVI